MPLIISDTFRQRKNLAQNQLIYLYAAEVSRIFRGEADIATSTNTLSSSFFEKNHYTGELFTDSSFDNTWYIYFHTGNYKGQMRQISSFDSSSKTFTFSPAFTGSAPSKGCMFRIAQMLFLAGTNYNINFYLPGTTISQVYTASPIKRESLSQTSSQETEGITVQLSNVDQSIIALLENYNALNGNKVYLLTTFIDPSTGHPYSDSGVGDTPNPNYILDVFYIGKVDAGYEVLQFELNPLFDVLGVEYPLRRYQREFCQWVYKSLQCGYAASFGLNLTDYPNASYSACDHTLYGANGCIAHTNKVWSGSLAQVSRFGGFPGLPTGRIYGR